MVEQRDKDPRTHIRKRKRLTATWDVLKLSHHETPCPDHESYSCGILMHGYEGTRPRRPAKTKRIEKVHSLSLLGQEETG